MPARLHAHFATAPSRIFYLEEAGSFLVGRDAACEVVLDDPQVSRRHARIVHDSGWRVEDLGSKNGLALDGRPLDAGTPIPLGRQSWLGFGDLLVRFDAIGEAERQAAADLELHRRQTSLQMQRRLDPAEGVEALLDRTLRSLVELSAAERGLVFLVDPDQPETLEAAAVFAPETPESSNTEAAALTASGGAVRRALQEGCPVTLADASLDTHFGSRPSIVGRGIRALLCLPLTVLGRTLGVLYADSRRPGSHFSELDVEILSALASHAALALAVARLHREVEGVHRWLPQRETVP